MDGLVAGASGAIATELDGVVQRLRARNLDDSSVGVGRSDRA